MNHQIDVSDFQQQGQCKTEVNAANMTTINQAQSWSSMEQPNVPNFVSFVYQTQNNQQDLSEKSQNSLQADFPILLSQINNSLLLQSPKKSSKNAVQNSSQLIQASPMRINQWNYSSEVKNCNQTQQSTIQSGQKQKKSIKQMYSEEEDMHIQRLRANNIN